MYVWCVQMGTICKSRHYGAPFPCRDWCLTRLSSLETGYFPKAERAERPPLAPIKPNAPMTGLSTSQMMRWWLCGNEGKQVVIITCQLTHGNSTKYMNNSFLGSHQCGSLEKCLALETETLKIARLFLYTGNCTMRTILQVTRSMI